MGKGTKIGIFDSGLGGLLILRNLREYLPLYDYVFFGDQAYVPYGNKTREELFARAIKILKHFFEVEGCSAVLIACNTNSTNLYDELKSWVNEHYEDRELWGIVRPTVEAIEPLKPVAFFGTHRTVESHVYKKEMEKLGSEEVYEVEMPELATRIENGGDTLGYISEFKNVIPENVEIGVLVCTHYGIVRENFAEIFPQVRTWICQEDILPKYVENYLRENIELEQNLSKDGSLKILVSAENIVFNKFANEWFGNTHIEVIEL